MVLLRREEGKALVLGAETWPKSPKAAGEVRGQYVFLTTRLGADGISLHRDHTGDTVVGKAARGDMELCWETWHSSVVLGDLFIVLRLHSTWGCITSQDGISGVRRLLFFCFLMGKGLRVMVLRDMA